MKEKKETIFEHLQELRRVIIISLAAIFLGMAGCYCFLRQPLMLIVLNPIQSIGKELVMIGVAEGFLVQLKLAGIGGIILASPVVLWQVMGFVLPALYNDERKIFLVSFFIALSLFFAGIFFAYVFVLELGLKIFLFDFAQEFTTMISASKYLSFFISFLFPFGLIFQIPLAACLLSRLGLITPNLLRNKRAYAVIVILIISAVLTPPDIFSQIILALPMFLLYEISILLAVLVDRKKKRNF